MTHRKTQVTSAISAAKILAVISLMTNSTMPPHKGRGPTTICNQNVTDHVVYGLEFGGAL